MTQLLTRLLRCSCTVVLLVGAPLSACTPYGSERLREAEQLSREGKHEEAIAAYKAHMESRLGVTNRPEWENPYFYTLLIGDVYLGKDEPIQAISAYEEAEMRGVHPSLVSDRYRSVARWYEDRHEYKNAFDLLVKYRSRDTLLFDSMLDRIGRTMTELEVGAPTSATP
jgi:tetratricopeptide (TPR) repeat protein